LTTETGAGPEAEAAAITEELKQRIDPSYEWGMRRTVPSQQPAHAVRVPDIRSVAAAWSRTHKEMSFDDLLSVCESLWASGWREERIAVMAMLGRRKETPARLAWGVIERWSASMDNWELVDNMAGLLTGPMLVARPDLVEAIESLSGRHLVWQRRLAVVTLIEAAREDPVWLGHLQAIAAQLKEDRGPTMRKAVDWARRTAAKVEARVG
jgi:3-methyladenine DNA glycosylase AlkD